MHKTCNQRSFDLLAINSKHEVSEKLIEKTIAIFKRIKLN